MAKTIVLGKGNVFYTKWEMSKNEDGTFACTQLGNFTKDEKKALDSGMPYIPCLKGAKHLTIKHNGTDYEVVASETTTTSSRKVKVADIPTEFTDCEIVLGKGKVMFIAFAVKTETTESGSTKRYFSLGNAGKTEENARAKYPTAVESIDTTLSGGKVIVRTYNAEGEMLTQLSEKEIADANKKAELQAKAEQAKAEQPSEEVASETETQA